MSIEAFRLLGIVSVDSKNAEAGLNRVDRLTKQTAQEVGKLDHH